MHGTPEVDLIKLMIGGGILLVFLGLYIWMLIHLQRCFQSVPQEYRKMTPGYVWLMLIPCFNLVWGFFVFPRLSESFQGYFTAFDAPKYRGDDCSRTISWLIPSFGAASIIPFVGYLTGLAQLVLLILFVVKTVGYRRDALQLAQTGSAPCSPDYIPPVIDSLANPNDMFKRP